MSQAAEEEYIEAYPMPSTTVTREALLEKGLQWKSMRTDIKKVMRSCPICQRLSEKLRESHGPEYIISVTEPNDTVTHTLLLSDHSRLTVQVTHIF